jgi:hypothetical protein
MYELIDVPPQAPQFALVVPQRGLVSLRLALVGDIVQQTLGHGGPASIQEFLGELIVRRDRQFPHILAVQEIGLPTGEHDDTVSLCARPARPTDPMDVLVRTRGEPRLEDRGHPGEIDPPCSDVRGKEDPASGLGKLFGGLDALRL